MYLLENDPSWTPETIRATMDAGKEQWVKVSAAVPVYITYQTALADDEGMLHSRYIIYGLDTGAVKTIEVAKIS